MLWIGPPSSPPLTRTLLFQHDAALALPAFARTSEQHRRQWRSRRPSRSSAHSRHVRARLPSPVRLDTRAPCDDAFASISARRIRFVSPPAVQLAPSFTEPEPFCSGPRCSAPPSPTVLFFRTDGDTSFSSLLESPFLCCPPFFSSDPARCVLAHWISGC